MDIFESVGMDPLGIPAQNAGSTCGAHAPAVVEGSGQDHLRSGSPLRRL